MAKSHLKEVYHSSSGKKKGEKSRKLSRAHGRLHLVPIYVTRSSLPPSMPEDPYQNPPQCRGNPRKPERSRLFTKFMSYNHSANPLCLVFHMLTNLGGAAGG